MTKRGGWRKKQSTLAYESGLMATKLGGLMTVDEEGLTYIMVVRKGVTFYIWREEAGRWAVSACEIDFDSHAIFKRAGQITVFMLDYSGQSAT